MKTRYRDVLDPNDPYWPRVRRLHMYLWANGTLATPFGWIVKASFIWLLSSLFFSLFSLVWRGALLFGALFLIDWIAPGMASCVFRESIGYEIALFALSHCAVFDVSYLSLISAVALVVMVLVLIYPIRTFLKKILEILFTSMNMMGLGYPLKFFAFLVSIDPALAGKMLDKSYIFSIISAAMPAVFPPEYKDNHDHLWDVYQRSQSPAHEQDLEDLLEELEARYFG